MKAEEENPLVFFYRQRIVEAILEWMCAHGGSKSSFHMRNVAGRFQC